MIPGVKKPKLPVAPQPPQAPMAPQQPQPNPIQGSFKKGGKVPSTGAFKLHKGERVLNVKQAKSMPLAKLEKAVTRKGK